MQMTKRITSDFEALSLSKLKEFTEAYTVELSSNGYVREGVVTRAPYFLVDHILTFSDVELADGGWWMDVDGDKRSLEDWNVVPNKYNDHSITVISNRTESNLINNAMEK